MSTKTIISKEWLLATSLLASFAIAPAALAQAPAAPPAEKTAESEEETTEAAPTRRAARASDADTVVITGTRLRGVETSGNIPGRSITIQEVEDRAFTNAVDILNDIPLVGAGANLSGNNGGQPSSLGSAFIDLLDLGTQRTLTLINGRRVVGANAGTLFVFGNETGGQVDVNIVPTALLTRIDVLTVGGAAAYGSDAIAGVVNFILKDDFDGVQVDVLGGANTAGDGSRATLRLTAGRNFADDRGNAVFALELTDISPIQADSRDFRVANPSGLPNFLNGGRRNANFAPTGPIDVAGLNNGAFLRATDDGVPGTVFTAFGGTSQIMPGGAVFTVTGAGPATAVNQIGPAGNTFFANNLQIVPGTPIANPAGSTGRPLASFAPSALPAGVTAASVFTAFGVTPPAGLTAAQQTTLAVNILQANRQTPREFLASRPGTSINAFAGTLIAPYPDVANTDPNSSAFLPRSAVPLRFNDQGNIEQYVLGRIGPGDPAVTGYIPGGDGFNPIFNTVLRVGQERAIFNFLGHYDVTPSIRLFNETSYVDIAVESARNGASANSAASGTVENAALIMNVNNPFLDATDRATLAAVGVTGNFVLSRTNQDVMGDNPFSAESQTFRTVNGVRGDFEVLGRGLEWEASVSYGKVEGAVTTFNIKDVEYALAIDAARDASGRIVCRSQLSSTLPTSVPGVIANLIRVPGADGIPTEQIFTPTATRAMVDACQPMDVFGFNRMSEASKAYVLAPQVYSAENTQIYGQAFLNGSLFDLPGGEFGFSIAGDWRQDEIDFFTDELNRLGRSRTAPSAQTKGETTTQEGGIEFSIPLFGGDFSFPLMRQLELKPAIRWTKQNGEAPTYRNLAGRLVNQSSEGDWNEITSIAANYRPLEDFLIRGNVTKSLRQPGVAELFLGGQPAFINAFTDPCDSRQLNSGPNPTLRRQNCEQAVIRAGLAGDRAAAANFLGTFIPTGAGVQGTFAGNPLLAPEEGSSWTAGFVYEPRFLDSFQLTIDFIELELENIIIPTNLTDALSFCFDGSAGAAIAAQACTFFSRDPTFNVTNGFASGFINIASRRVQAFNGSLDWTLDLDSTLKRESDWGNLRIKANAYNLQQFDDSPSGTFRDTQRSDGRFDRPSWETQLILAYDRGPLFTQWTWNWVDKTELFSGGQPVTKEVRDIISYSDASVHNATIAYDLGPDDEIRLQLTVDNVFDKTTYGQIGFFDQQYADQLGRRYTVSLRARF
jgi:outer membrane receptor protein involved in Fe transport